MMLITRISLLSFCLCFFYAGMARAQAPTIKSLQAEGERVLVFMDSLAEAANQRCANQVSFEIQIAAIEAMMMEEGQGEVLQQRLNAFAEAMDDYLGLGQALGPIAMDGADHPIFSHSRKTKKLSYTQLHFTNKNLKDFHRALRREALAVRGRLGLLQNSAPDKPQHIRIDRGVDLMYWEVENKVTITVPGYDGDVLPELRAQGGTVKRLDAPNEFLVIPNGYDRITLQIILFGKMYVETFEVAPLPAPRVDFVQNGRVLDAQRGLRIQGLSTLEARVIVDDYIRKYFPRELNYEDIRWQVQLGRGQRPVGEPLLFSESTGNLSALQSKARQGDRLILSVEALNRTCSDGRKVPVEVNITPISIPLF